MSVVPFGLREAHRLTVCVNTVCMAVAYAVLFSLSKLLHLFLLCRPDEAKKKKSHVTWFGTMQDSGRTIFLTF